MSVIQYNGFCERGMRNGVNQDVIGMYCHEECRLFFVSDGIGGHYAGEKASGAIGTALADWWQEYIADISLDFQETVGQIQSVLENTHTAIQKETAGHGICGATIVLLFIQGRRYAVLWSGDSRGYMLERQLFHTGFKQLTTDDTWENNLTDGYSEKEIRKNPFFGKLLCAVGAGEKFSCHLQTGEIKGKTLFALCSDGVYKYVEKEKMYSEFKTALKKGNVADGIKHLRNMVYENNAPDNLSCILVGLF